MATKQQHPSPAPAPERTFSTIDIGHILDLVAFGAVAAAQPVVTTSDDDGGELLADLLDAVNRSFTDQIGDGALPRAVVDAVVEYTLAQHRVGPDWIIMPRPPRREAE